MNEPQKLKQICLIWIEKVVKSQHTWVFSLWVAMSLVASATEMLYLGKYQGIPRVYIPGVYLGYTQGIPGAYQHTWVFSLWVAMSLVASATEMLESCPTQANLLPSAEKLTEWTQPPPWKSENHIITKLSIKSLCNFFSCHTLPCIHFKKDLSHTS